MPFDFEIGDHVVCDEVEMTVISIWIRPGHVQYECAWMADSQRRTAYFETFEIRRKAGQ